MTKKSTLKTQRIQKSLFYPLMGLAIALAIPAGWLIYRIGPQFTQSPRALLQALDSEITHFWHLYLYMLVSSVITLTTAGFAVGWRDDRIRKHYHDLLSQRRLLRIKNKQLARLSITDPLTGLANRLHFRESLANEYKRALRYNLDLCVMVMDIDYFKRINDSSGHTFGDFVLHEIGQLFASSRRESDHVARTGGEEFCFLLTQTNMEDAAHFAQRLRTSVAEHRFEYQGKKTEVRLSAGLATMKDLGDSPPDDQGQTLYRFADEALYEAKHRGRNRVERYQKKLLDVSAIA